MKQDCVSLNLAKIELMTDKEVARNLLTEQQFQFRIESSIEYAYMWDDELVKAIALSCVPQGIIDEKN